ncbi:MAG: hypothetical protein MUP98_12800 [Candidatus Aminicenantes bacterium]|nr:hypothetical protein [Candidatus Aminicenantes bacterium]
MRTKKRQALKKGSKGSMDKPKSLIAFFRYNVFTSFSGKFIYVFLLAIVLFLVIIILYVLNNDASPRAENIYNFLLIPGVLLIFYPSAFSIQNDVDSRMIETLFGIPDYRYKIWLVRSLTQYIVIGALLFILTVLCRLGLAEFSVGSMLFHLMFPVIFIGSLGFMIAALTRSGSGTAVILVIVILFFWIALESVEGSSLYIFHNPFQMVDQMETIILAETTLLNRVYLLVGSIITMLFGLLRLQHREKFI